MNSLCSPYHERYYKGNHRTCFSKTQLINICTTLKIPYKSSSTKDELWNQINIQMFSKYSCSKGNEHCWLDKLNINGIMIYDDFLRQYYEKKDENVIGGVCEFLKIYDNKIKIIFVGYQLFIKKIKN